MIDLFLHLRSNNLHPRRTACFFCRVSFLGSEGKAMAQWPSS